MTNREIKKYIDRLNNGKSGESIFIRPISENVDVAKVWSEQPKITDEIVGNFGSHRFFFIKNEQSKYVGAVLDMNRDLHWFIVANSRKKGYLTNALKESILPYLFNKERGNQRLTIEKSLIGEQNYLNSRRVADKLGFKAINQDKTEFDLKQSEFDWENENLNEKNTEIKPQRFEELRKRAFYAFKTLSKISDELLMTIDDDKELKEVTDEVKNYTWKIEDLEWENKKTKG